MLLPVVGVGGLIVIGIIIYPIIRDGLEPIIREGIDEAVEGIEAIKDAVKKRRCAAMQAMKNRLCGLTHKCTGEMKCSQLRLHMMRKTACMAWRLRIMIKCFDGGNQPHRDELNKERENMGECIRLY